MNKKIIFPFVGDSIGGSHISSILLIKELKKKKINVKIILHKKGPLTAYLKKQNLKFEYLKLKELPGQYFTFFNFFKDLFNSYKKIRNYLRNDKDVDIVHGNDLRINLLWSFSSFFLKKFIWHQRTLLKRKNSLLGIYMFIFSKKIVCISKSVSDSLPFYLNSYKKTIYNPINFKYLKPKVNKKKIFFLSKLTKNKGADLVYELVKDKRFIYKILIIGAGVYKQKFKKLNKINIKFKNSISNPNLIFNINSIVLCPSRFEGFGRVLAEAIIANSSVIASNILAHKEINHYCINKKNLTIFEFKNKDTFFNLIKKEISRNKIFKEEIKLKKLTSTNIHFQKIINVYNNI